MDERTKLQKKIEAKARKSPRLKKSFLPLQCHHRRDSVHSWALFQTPVSDVTSQHCGDSTATRLVAILVGIKHRWKALNHAQLEEAKQK